MHGIAYVSSMELYGKYQCLFIETNVNKNKNKTTQKPNVNKQFY